MYSKDAFNPTPLPHCFSNTVKQGDIPLVLIQEIIGLVGGTITSMMVALAPVRKELQQAATEVGKDLAMDIVLQHQCTCAETCG